MPIANCIVTPNCHQGSGNLVDLWAAEAGQSVEHMTINIVFSSEQFGNKYGVMATLLLPSIWSPTDISLLQLGLARALAKHFKLSPSEVQVVTSIITSGMVVEDGEEIQW